jgi:hypothetical protein
MFYIAQSNQYIPRGVAFTIGDVQYPANWFNLATEKDLADIGAVPVQVIGAPKPELYYSNSTVLENGTLTYVADPRDLNNVKAVRIDEIKSQVKAILSNTDYVDVRNLRDPAYKPDVVAWRDAVRAASKDAVNFINNASNVDAVAAVEATWPEGY